MNIQELRNLSKEISEKRIRHGSIRAEDERRRVMENAKKQVPVRRISYDRCRKRPVGNPSSGIQKGLMGFIVCGAAVASVAVWIAFSGFVVKRNQLDVQNAVEQEKLVEFTGGVINAGLKGSSENIKSKWNSRVSRQIIACGSKRLDEFAKSGNFELKQVAYDPNTSCYLVRYGNVAEGTIVFKVTKDGKFGLGLVGIQ